MTPPDRQNRKNLFIPVPSVYPVRQKTQLFSQQKDDSSLERAGEKPNDRQSIAFLLKKRALGIYSEQYEHVVNEARNGNDERVLHELGKERAKALQKIEMPRKTSEILSAVILGQWLGAWGLGLGADQLFSGKIKVGDGWRIAEQYGLPFANAAAKTVAETLMLPLNVSGALVGGVLKGTETAIDLSRSPLEKKIIRRTGFVADFVATAFGQRWQWVYPLLEGGEKLFNAAMGWKSIGTPQQIIFSVANIIGGVVRYLLDGIILIGGVPVRRAIEKTMNWADGKFLGSLKKRREQGERELAENNEALVEFLGEGQGRRLITRLAAMERKYDTDVPHSERGKIWARRGSEQPPARA